MAKNAYKKDSERLRASFLEQASELWEKCDSKFFEALDESDSKRIKLAFGASLNLKEREFVVDVDLAFKDKTTEGGLEVNKTFHASKRVKLNDPEQPELPGADAEKTDETTEGEKKPKGKKKAGKKGEAEQPSVE